MTLLILCVGLLLSSCNAHNLIANTRPFGTPIPTLIPATLPAVSGGEEASGPKCSVRAVDLLAAWVTAGYPETDTFDFSGSDGVACLGTFAADVLPLFTRSNIWYTGAAACVTCHFKDVVKAQAQMSLEDYADILAGSRRTSADAKGNDILGGGNWETSKMHEVLMMTKLMPLGRPANMPDKGPLVKAGQPK
jgi:hypothetical protein